MPLRPDSEPSSSPSGLTPSGLDLRCVAGPLIYLVQASGGKTVHVPGSRKQHGASECFQRPGQKFGVKCEGCLRV
ncbi:hypothetical protein F2P79_020274 [Pimephales promelas]|nr:hypothetical protein F2P79_020274 [Pimephales promelas]